MQKVDFPHLQPSVCFVCTTASAEAYADTLRENHTLVQTPLTGRKYICAGCASSAADALGLFDEGKRRVEEALAVAKAATDRLAKFEKLSALIAEAQLAECLVTSLPKTAADTFPSATTEPELAPEAADEAVPAEEQPEEQVPDGTDELPEGKPGEETNVLDSKTGKPITVPKKKPGPKPKAA